MNSSRISRSAERLAGEADDEAGAEGDAGNGGADFLESLQEDVCACAALHGFENGGRGVLEGTSRYLQMLSCLAMVSSKLAGDAVGVGVEEAEPAEAVDAGECVEEGGEAVLDAKVFAVAGGVLADEGDFLDAAGDELAGFGDDGLEAAGTEFAAQVGDDAEGAGVVAAFGDFDVGGGFGVVR